MITVLHIVSKLEKNLIYYIEIWKIDINRISRNENPNI